MINQNKIREEIKSLDSRINKLKNRIYKAEQLIESFCDDIREEECSIRPCMETIKSFYRDLEKAEHQLSDLDEELSSLEDKFSDLQQQLSSLTKIQIETPKLPKELKDVSGDIELGDFLG